MDYDKNKVDDCTLALMYLVMWDEEFGARAWKGFDWDTLNRLHERGYISNPKGKAKSVFVTPAGQRRAEELFNILFSPEEGLGPA